MSSQYFTPRTASEIYDRRKLYKNIQIYTICRLSMVLRKINNTILYRLNRNPVEDSRLVLTRHETLFRVIKSMVQIVRTVSDFY